MKKKNQMTRLLDFLYRLEESKIYHRLNRVRDGIMVEIAIPWERWEVEFMEDGSVDVEKFEAAGIFDEKELEKLFIEPEEPKWWKNYKATEKPDASETDNE